MILRPDLYVQDVTVLSPGSLLARGIGGVILDLDNTILPRFTRQMPRASAEWVASLTEAGIGVCLVSNNWHGAVSEHADALGVPLVARALKPFPFGYRRALRIMGVSRKRTAVVGDQVFTDVLGGNLAGMFTVMVTPLSAEDLPHTLLLRRIEARIMSGMEPRTSFGATPDDGGSLGG